MSKTQLKTSFWRTISNCCQQIDRCPLGLLWNFINFPVNLHQQFVFRASRDLIKRPTKFISRWTLLTCCLFGLHRIWSRDQPGSYPGERFDNAVYLGFTVFDHETNQVHTPVNVLTMLFITLHLRFKKDKSFKTMVFLH